MPETRLASVKMDTSERTQFYGIHHLALNTDDMQKTVDFYAGVLGMSLIHAMKVPPGLGVGSGNRGNPPFEEIRHYFFDMGRDSLLAFFEIPKGAKPHGDRDAIAAMQHVSFAVSPSSATRIRARLEECGISYLGPIESFPDVFSVYFFDPNGIRLEMSWQPRDGEGEPRVVEGLTQTKAEAMKELETLTPDRDWLNWSVSALPGAAAR
jgi:catechol 2,3-dioxygenase-like lactoylglutathione lyase family enzyme